MLGPKYDTCKLHPEYPVVHVECDCIWWIRDKDDDHWEVEHKGCHNHKAPPAWVPSKETLQKRRQVAARKEQTQKDGPINGNDGVDEMTV